MNLDEVQAAGRFAWHPDGNLIHVPGEGVLLLLVDEGGLIYDILKPKQALPAWALAGWRHERACACRTCAEEYPLAAATAEPALPRPRESFWGLGGLRRLRHAPRTRG